MRIARCEELRASPALCEEHPFCEDPVTQLGRKKESGVLCPNPVITQAVSGSASANGLTRRGLLVAGAQGALAVGGAGALAGCGGASQQPATTATKPQDGWENECGPHRGCRRSRSWPPAPTRTPTTSSIRAVV